MTDAPTPVVLRHGKPRCYYIESNCSPGECWELIEGREPTEYEGHDTFTIIPLFDRPPSPDDQGSPPAAIPTEQTDDPWAELERLAKAATPGEWHALGGYLTVRDPDSGSFSSTIYHLDELGQKGPDLPFQAVPFARAGDAAFIAAAKRDVLKLIEAARQGGRK